MTGGKYHILILYYNIHNRKQKRKQEILEMLNQCEQHISHSERIHTSGGITAHVPILNTQVLILKL